MAGGLELRLIGDPAVVRLTTTDVPALPPVVATDTTLLDPVEGESAEAVGGASVLGARTPMELTGQAKALPLVGSNGGLSDLTAALREYGDTSTEVPISELLVAADTPPSVLAEVRELGVPLNDRRTEGEELDLLRSDAFSLGWRVFLLVGVLTLVLAFLGVLALAVVQLRWRSYEVAALRVVGVRRRDLRRAIVAEYVALLGMAVVGGALAAIASLLLVLPVARHRRHRRVRPGCRLQPALAGDGWRARRGDDRRAGDRPVDLAPYGQAGHARDAAAGGCAIGAG